MDKKKDTSVVVLFEVLRDAFISKNTKVNATGNNNLARNQNVMPPYMLAAQIIQDSKDQTRKKRDPSQGVDFLEEHHMEAISMSQIYAQGGNRRNSDYQG